MGSMGVAVVAAQQAHWPYCRRKVYDQTGSIEDSEELAGEEFNELYEYYRTIYAKVTSLPA